MGRLYELAYIRGIRMGAYIAERDGATEARRRGSLAEVVYQRASMRNAYDQGYFDAITDYASKPVKVSKAVCV